MSETAATNRFEALDGWRGVCACFVVLFHFHGFSPVYSSPLVRNSYLFVDFFFVLSGFVIAWNYATRLGTWAEVKRFLVLRVGRLYPLHFFMLLCFLAFETARLFGGSSNSATPPFTGEMQPAAVLSNLFLVQSLHLHDSLTWNGPAWSISTEAWTYVLFALVCLTLGLKRWLLAVVALGAPLLLLRLSDTGMDVTYDWGLVRCVFGFALGVACCFVHRRRVAVMATQPKRTSITFATLVELLAVFAVVKFVSAADRSALSLLAPFVFAAAVLIFASEDGWVSRLFRSAPLRWLGTLSYSIYLTHFFIVLLMPKAIKAVFHADLWTPMRLASGEVIQAYGRNDVEGTLFFALALVLTIAFSALTYRWVETPGRDWSRRFAGRARPANSLNGPSATTPSVQGGDAKSISTSTARRA